METTTAVISENPTLKKTSYYCKVCNSPVAKSYEKKNINYYYCSSCDLLQNYYWEEHKEPVEAKIVVNDKGRAKLWPAGERQHMLEKGWEILELMTSPVAWFSRNVHTNLKLVPQYSTWTKNNARKQLSRILDFGCGHGVTVQELRKEGFDIVGLDPYSPTEDESIITVSLHERKFKDNEFDGIFTIETMEHIPNILEVFSELRRILKPGGTLLVQTRRLEDPDYIAQKDKWFYLNEPTMHVAIYSEKAMKEIAKRVGFAEVSFRGAKFARFVK